MLVNTYNMNHYLQLLPIPIPLSNLSQSSISCTSEITSVCVHFSAFLQLNWSHLFLPFLSVLSYPYHHATHFPNWSQTDLLRDATLIIILFCLQPFTGIPLLSGWKTKAWKAIWNFCVICPNYCLCFTWDLIPLLAFESQYHNYIEKLFFFLFTLLSWVLCIVWCINHTLCITHPKSGRQGLKIKHKTQKQKGESMLSGSIGGVSKCCYFIIALFSQIQQIWKIIHQVIYLGSIWEEMKAHWWMGLGNLHKLTDIDRMSLLFQVVLTSR